MASIKPLQIYIGVTESVGEILIPLYLVILPLNSLDEILAPLVLFKFSAGKTVEFGCLPLIDWTSQN